jgi:hypothetical protein
MVAAPIRARPPEEPLNFGQPQRAAADVTSARPMAPRIRQRELPPPTPETEVPAYRPPGVPIYDRFGEQVGTRPIPSTTPSIYATEPPSFMSRLLERVREKYRYKSAAPGAPSALPRHEREAERAISQNVVYGQRAGKSPEEIQRDTEQDLADLAADEGKWSNQLATMLADFVDPAMLVGGIAGERAAVTAIQGAASRGIPWATRVLRLMETPEGAPLVRRLIARTTHGLATGGAANVGFQAAGAAEEGRLLTPAEVAHTFAIGTALAPALEAGGTLAGAPFRRAPRAPGPPDFDALANEARELSILKTRTPAQQARLRTLTQQLQGEGERMAREEPPARTTEEVARAVEADAPLPRDIIERERRRPEFERRQQEMAVEAERRLAARRSAEVETPQDIAQGAMFSPARRPTKPVPPADEAELLASGIAKHGEPLETSARRVAEQGHLDDVTAKRLGFSKADAEGLNRLMDDLSLIHEEGAWRKAVTTERARVVVEVEGREVPGTVIIGAEDPINGLGRRGMALVEHRMEGQLVQRWYPATRLRPEAEIGSSRARPLQETEYPAAETGPGSPVGPRTVAGEGGRPPLALTPEPEGPAQRAMFGAREGTPAARNLAQTEAAARSEIETLRQRFAAERDPARKSEIARQIAERQKLLNRAGAIGEEELRTRAAAEQPEPVPTGPDQLALLSPDLPASYTSRLRQMGAKAPTPAEEAEVKTLMEISRNLAEAVRVPLRQGRFNAAQRQAAGVFKPHAEVTRVLRYDRLDTVAHEVGHFLSKKYLRNPTTVRGGRGARLPKEAARELVQMGRDLYGSRKPVSGYGEEGIAEWVSFYVTEPHTLTQKAPAFTAYMDGILTEEPMLRAALDQARADFATYRQAPQAARTDAQISVGERQRFAPTVRDYMRVVADDTYDVRWAVQQLGTKRPASEDAGILARLTRGAFGEAQEWLERGVLKAGTAEERLNAGIAETFGPLVRAGRAQELRRYLAAESALERWEHGIDPGFAREDAQAMVDLYAKDPEIRAAAEAAWAHSTALLEARRAAGLLTDEQFKQISAKNQRRVGFYRIFEPEETRARTGGTQGGIGSSGIKRQTGSARRTVDPIEAIIRDTYDTAKKVEAHNAKRALVEHALATEAGGDIVEEVPAPMRSVAIPIEKLKQQLADLGIVYEGIDAKTGERFTAPLGGPGGAQIEALLQAFTEARTAGGAEAKDLVFPMLMKGDLRWFAVKDAKLYDALVGLGPQELDIWRRVLSFPKRLLQTGATTTLEFGFGNLSRDIVAQSVFSKSWRPPLWRHLEGLYHVLRRDPVYQRFRLHGAEQATMGGVDRATLQISARRLFGYFRTIKQAWLDRQQAWSRATPVQKGVYVLSDLERVVLSPFEALRTVKELSETMGRVGEFAAVERQALKRGAQPIAAAKEAALGARDVGIDFQQLGSATREVNHVVAFFGAWLRGWAQLGRELKTRPHVVIPRIVAEVTVPSLALYYLQRKDPVYRNMAAWKRDLFWVYVQRGDEPDPEYPGHGKVMHIWMFPKPFELGLLFGTLPERAAEWHDRDDPTQADRMGDALKRMAPPWIPTAAVPLIENYRDRSTFRDRPIVPRSREKLDAAEQYAPQTGETARLLGRALGYSPAKIENLVRGWSGGAGMYGLSATNAVVRVFRAAEGLPPLKAPQAPSTEDPLLNVPGLRRFLSRVPAEDAESVERLYQDFERAERHRQTWRAMLKEGRRSEASAYLDQHHDAILSVASSEELGEGRRGPLREAYQQMQELQTAKRALMQAAVPGGRERAVEVMRRLGGAVREMTP